MANRDMTNQLYSFDKMRKFVNVRVSVGASGAVTLDAAKSKGVASVTRNSAGNWTIQFGYIANSVTVADQYTRLLSLSTHMKTDGVGANARTTASYGCDVVSDTVATDGKITVQFAGPTNSTTTTAIAVDPANGEVAFLEFEFADSDAP